ncbi:hydroxypyruvate isomerase family protein [Martelella alba]|uniref:TIM barrel protein n=1 Tax=Martelella alba TaxID=2590451 RepID=A0ABY2SNG3_9HYPH|nr:TIM barrel protein [Martelella alba]TKI05988.1 TIM barrel protein [Martelella alba]
MIRLAANLTMLYEEYDFFDRFNKAAEDGFKAVEFFFPYGLDAEKINSLIQKNQQELVLFNMPLGDWDAGDRGFAAQPARKEEFRGAIEQAVKYGRLLQPPRINCPSGPSEDNAASWSTLKENFEMAAESLKGIGIKLVVEPINHNDVPHALISNVAQAVKFFDSMQTDNIFVQYDLYHSIRAGEDPYAVLKSHIDRIDHIQIADVPGRHQIGTGAVDFEKFFGLLDNLGYQGWISLEYHPEGNTSDSFQKIRKLGLLS